MIGWLRWLLRMNATPDQAERIMRAAVDSELTVAAIGRVDDALRAVEDEARRDPR